MLILRSKGGSLWWSSSLGLGFPVSSVDEEAMFFRGRGVVEASMYAIVLQDGGGSIISKIKMFA